MGKPIEQRGGGPNSIKSLINKGYYAEGSLQDNNVNSIVRGGQVIPVRPLSVTFDVGTPVERTLTVFKPTGRTSEVDPVSEVVKKNQGVILQAGEVAKVEWTKQFTNNEWTPNREEDHNDTERRLNKSFVEARAKGNQTLANMILTFLTDIQFNQSVRNGIERAKTLHGRMGM